MVSILEPHLELLEREAGSCRGSTPAEQASVVTDLAALHVALYSALERQIGPHGVTEAHRPLVPLFRRWIDTARRIVKAGAELKRQGQNVEGIDDLVRSINHAKPVGEQFDWVVGLNARIARGEEGTYRPLAEFLEELRSK